VVDGLQLATGVGHGLSVVGLVSMLQDCFKVGGRGVGVHLSDDSADFLRIEGGRE
jgi:hypothetical protein